MRVSIVIASCILAVATSMAWAQAPSVPPTRVCEIGTYACPNHTDIQATWPARCPMCQTVLTQVQPSADIIALGGREEHERHEREEARERVRREFREHYRPYGYPYYAPYTYAAPPSGYFYYPSQGFYYNPSLGFYFYPNTGYYYNPYTGQYYYYNPNTRQYYYAYPPNNGFSLSFGYR